MAPDSKFKPSRYVILSSSINYTLSLYSLSLSLSRIANEIRVCCNPILSLIHQISTSKFTLIPSITPPCPQRSHRSPPSPFHLLTKDDISQLNRED
ncbi:hypothetical protein HanRHA438_Chr03g0106981 [Helianthus annuus]|uniref:Uncharacterized protein n=1 Tax=Helianthus annuus TaxID=4232 RepID=A0A251V6C2_HELAN|nr:hypothetical protein HanXRQr2_Chr03g0095871 [Helianthus annuus]KAJ0592023.1 hypothetical protein HanHA300_Chr03g0080091 [Helianthus annuus]KAJ0599420.1 hypothetical protein HanIR_Chr03g0104661 [Helianthus annuus]KAJ0607001.1 hypothetical protein HanHA89_Chr03g0091481 [Helianthus annuus]KAJ0767061.1 hypothetical protein HanLR1_Chr03g0084771 [Helianthus annuus]